MERLLTQKEVARQLGISGRTLERHRVTGTGPRWLRLGRLVRYRISDLEEWVELSVRRSTSDNAEAWLAALPDLKGEPEARNIHRRRNRNRFKNERASGLAIKEGRQPVLGPGAKVAGTATKPTTRLSGNPDRTTQK